LKKTSNSVSTVEKRSWGMYYWHCEDCFL